MFKQFGGGGSCSLCGSKNVSKTTCPLNKDAKNPNPFKHYNAQAPKAADAPKAPKIKATAPKVPKIKALTLGDYVGRMHLDMMRDFHYPLRSMAYLVHFTDKEIDDLINKILIAGKEMIKTKDDKYLTPSRNDKIKTIVLSSLGYELTPELSYVRTALINDIVAFGINWSDDDDVKLRKKDEIEDRLLSKFARECFRDFKGNMMPNWRMGPLCTKSTLKDIEEVGKEIVGVPASLVNKCQYYLKNIMSTDIGIKELRNLGGNITLENAPEFKFSEFPKKDDKFLKEFLPEMRSWMNESYVSISDIADILYTTMILKKLNNPEASRHLAFLMDFIDNNAHVMTIAIITMMVKILNFQ